jgi:hypothetical protein
MAVFCPVCGKENADGSRFCQSCGANIPVPPAATPSTPAYTPPTAYPQAQPSYQQPYQQPAYQQPYQPPYQQPYQPAAYTQVVVKSKSGSGTLVGGVILMIAALVIIVCTFTPWMTSNIGGGYGASASLSGWDMKDMMNNQFFDWGDGKPVFSGICSLIIGGLIAGAALLMLITRSKSLSGLALLFSILAIAIAGTNTYSILAVGEGISLGFGMILFLIFSVVALVGSFISMSG